MTLYRELMEGIGTAVDAAGVLVIVIGALRATGRFLFRRQEEAGTAYRRYRQNLGKAILLGLEFLVDTLAGGPSVLTANTQVLLTGGSGRTLAHSLNAGGRSTCDPWSKSRLRPFS